jgi:hypothetical protein
LLEESSAHDEMRHPGGKKCYQGEVMNP